MYVYIYKTIIKQHKLSFTIVNMKMKNEALYIIKKSPKYYNYKGDQKKQTVKQ